MKPTFADPPREYRMLQIIHGMGRFRTEEPGLAALLDERGYGGAVVNVDFTDQYLESQEDWQVFLDGFDDLRKRGLRVWVYDEKGYPSLKAGGIVLRDHPEYEAVGLACVRTEGEGRITHVLPQDHETDPAPVYAVALPIDENGHHDLGRAVTTGLEPSADGKHLTFDAPEGRWAVLSLHRHVMYEGTHCVTNLSDDLRYPNLLDRDATAAFIRVTHDRYAEHLADRMSEVEALFTDEPSLMTVYLAETETARPVVPWSRTFEADYLARHGSPVWADMSAAFEDAGEEGVYARLRFWQTASQLIEDNFYGQIESWCEKHGVGSSGHALWEEHLFWQVGFEGDLYRALRRMHVPGIDLLSSYPHGLVRSDAIPIPKFVSSVAHMGGRRYCMSETSSHSQRMAKQPVSFEQRIGTINWQYAQGLNQITSYYGLDEMPPEDMKRFNDHIGRLGALLTDGRHIADVAVYYPIAAAWAAYVPTDKPQQAPGEEIVRIHQAFADTCNVLLQHQRDYDIVDDQAILEAEIAGEALRIRDEAFRCLVVPAARAIPREVFEQIGHFAAAGGCVLFVQPAPEFGLSAEDTEAIRELWPGLLDAKCLLPVRDPGLLPPLIEESCPADVSLDEPCETLLYCHREKDGRHLYFLANCDDQPVRRTVTFRCQGQPELWHPTTGEMRPVDAHVSSDGKTTIDLSFNSFEGYFVVFP